MNDNNRFLYEKRALRAENTLAWHLKDKSYFRNKYNGKKLW